MKGALRLSRLKVIGAMSSLLLTTVACSGSEEKQSSELEVSAEGEGGGNEAAPAAEETAAETPEAAPAEAPAAEAVAEAPAPTPAAAPAAAPAAEVNKNRVVRYVKAKEAVLRGGPSDQAPEKGRLQKGDTVVVEEQGDWSKVNEESFVKTTELSKKPVKRQREKATWNK